MEKHQEIFRALPAETAHAIEVMTNLEIPQEYKDAMILKSASDTELRSRLFVEYHI